MKKYVSFCLALLLLLACVTALASCGKDEMPELDLKKAAKNLEKEGYSVEYEKNPTDGDIELADMDVEIVSAGLVEYLDAWSEDYGDCIGMAKFESEKLAKLWYQYFKLEVEDYIKFLEYQRSKSESLLKETKDMLSSDEIEELKEMIKDHEKELERFKEIVVERDGDVIWIGTPKAIRDTK